MAFLSWAVVVAACFGLWASSLWAAEGMWPPSQVVDIRERLQEAGLRTDGKRLPAFVERLGAVGKLGGCTASFVSPDGLILTNYHCVIGSLQQRATVDENLLNDGFLARSREEEIATSPGTTFLMAQTAEDVTERMRGGMEGLPGKRRFEELEARRKALVAACEDRPGARCRVVAFHEGLQYLLMRELAIIDVRLVYAPPAGIGRFGGDADNFMWPRQTGDFALLRAYVGPSGAPAPSGPDNRAYRPRQYLRLAEEALSSGDFVMVVGYPGSTNRHAAASEVEAKFGTEYALLIEKYGKWLQLLRELTADDPEAALAYAGYVSGLENTLKFVRGMMSGFEEADVLSEKRRFAEDVDRWIAQDDARCSTHGRSIAELEAAVEERRQFTQADFSYHLATSSSLLKVAKRIERLARERKKPDAEREAGYQERDWERIRQSLQRTYKRFDQGVDKAIWKAFLLEYVQMPPDERRSDLDAWFRLGRAGQAGELVKAILDQMYAETDLLDPERALELLEADLEAIEASTDPFLRLAVHLREGDLRAEERKKENAGRIGAARLAYMTTLLDFLDDRERTIYPDANGTLRISYGHVLSDASSGKAFSTARDVLAKTTGEEPYDTPHDVVQSMKAGRFGAFTDAALGSLPINFRSTADVTGGHSGSPTLDSRGDLVGVLFDTTFENAISDWEYNPATAAAIHADMRYLLWLLRENRAHELLDELAVRPVESRPAAAPNP